MEEIFLGKTSRKLEENQNKMEGSGKYTRVGIKEAIYDIIV